ncbi:hypothetical protein ACFL2I_02825 [Candidatus Omnitrophota bacterium]
MGWFVALLGIFWITIGILGLVAHKKLNLAMTNFVKNTKRQQLGLISLIFGVVLLVSAGSVRETWFVLALGIIACLKGATTIMISDQKLKAIIDWWLAAPEIVQKWWAVLVLVLGVAMFYVI